MKRMIAVFLLPVLFLSLLLSCSPVDVTEEAGTLASAEDDWYYGLDFGGKKLAVRYGEETAMSYTKGPDEKGGDSVLNRCYDRNRTVAATLHLQVEARMGENTLEYMNEIALMPDGCPDLVMLENGQIFYATMNGFLSRVNPQDSEEGEHYFRFQDASWYLDFMQGMSIDKDRLYALAGDYFTDVLRKSQALYLNTNYYREKVASYLPLEQLYDMIARGRWNADEMQAMIEMAWEDMGRQGMADSEDGLGFLCRTGGDYYPFMYGTDITVLEMTNDGWMMKENPLAYSDLVDSIMQIYNADGSLLNSSAFPAKEQLDLFCRGRVLFTTGFSIGDLERSEMHNMQEKIALVYPLMSNLQGYYRTYVSFHGEIGVIPLRAKQNFKQISAYVQLLNEQSTDIIDEYYEESLKFKYSTEAIGAGRMLDVIHDSIGSGLSYYVTEAAGYEANLPSTAFFSSLVSTCVHAEENSFLRQWAQYRYAYQGGLDRIKEKYAALAE